MLRGIVSNLLNQRSDPLLEQPLPDQLFRVWIDGDRKPRLFQLADPRDQITYVLDCATNQRLGNARDLGIELNFKLYYQAKDGVLNDDLDKMGGFFTSLEYGVLFPFGGLGYLPDEVIDYAQFQNPGDEPLDTGTAQTVRWYLGILF